MGGGGEQFHRGLVAMLVPLDCSLLAFPQIRAHDKEEVSAVPRRPYALKCCSRYLRQCWKHSKEQVAGLHLAALVLRRWYFQVALSAQLAKSPSSRAGIEKAARIGYDGGDASGPNGQSACHSSRNVPHPSILLHSRGWAGWAGWAGSWMAVNNSINNPPQPPPPHHPPPHPFPDLM